MTLLHAARRLSAVLQHVANGVSLVQLLMFLPLSLDHSQSTFLTFSAIMALFYFSLASMQLMFAKTPLVLIPRTMALVQNVVILIIMFLCARLYAPESASSPAPPSIAVPWMQSVSAAQAWLMSRPLLGLWPTSSSKNMGMNLGPVREPLLHMAKYVLARLPGLWYAFLRSMSPVFSLLEGLASLLVVQGVARFSQWLYVSILTAAFTTRMASARAA